MLSVLGYLINSVILVVIIVVVARIYMDFRKEETEKIFLGPLVKEISDLILENSKKFFPLQGSALLWTTLGVSIVLFIAVKAILI